MATHEKSSGELCVLKYSYYCYLMDYLRGVVHGGLETVCQVGRVRRYSIDGNGLFRTPDDRQ